MKFLAYFRSLAAIFLHRTQTELQLDLPQNRNLLRYGTTGFASFKGKSRASVETILRARVERVGGVPAKL